MRNGTALADEHAVAHAELIQYAIEDPVVLQHVSCSGAALSGSVTLPHSEPGRVPPAQAAPVHGFSIKIEWGTCFVVGRSGGFIP